MSQTPLKMLSADDVIRIHDVLVMDFAQSNDPISPAGIRSYDLLESAVSRQSTGLGNTLKYPDPVSNAATLLYGICCDHPFLNGNKRIALVAMLAHLDKNKLALYDTNQQDLYDLMLDVASHTLLGRKPDRRARSPKDVRPDSDAEVAHIATWLKGRAEGVSKGERVITYRQLRGILAKFGYYLEPSSGMSADVCKYERRKSFITGKEKVERKRIGTVSCPGDGVEVGRNELKRIRLACRLTEEDGVDSDAFYSEAAMIDYFVSRYRKVLRWLAKT